MQLNDQGGRYKILVVEDDQGLVRMLRLTLRDGGYNVDTAANGQEALRKLDASTPDAIILDLQMPVMDGRTFYRELRARGSDAPVLILSAIGARRAHVELGAQAYLDKPFRPQDLLDAVCSLCGPSRPEGQWLAVL